VKGNSLREAENPIREFDLPESQAAIDFFAKPRIGFEWVFETENGTYSSLLYGSMEIMEYHLGSSRIEIPLNYIEE